MQLIIGGKVTELRSSRQEVLEHFLTEVRALVVTHERMAAGESDDYWTILDALHHLVKKVESE